MTAAPAARNWSHVVFDRQGRTIPIDHGTRRGYLQHRRRHLPVCEACLAAYTADPGPPGLLNES